MSPVSDQNRMVHQIMLMSINTRSVVRATREPKRETGYSIKTNFHNSVIYSDDSGTPSLCPFLLLGGGSLWLTIRPPLVILIWSGSLSLNKKSLNYVKA